MIIVTILTPHLIASILEATPARDLSINNMPIVYYTLCILDSIKLWFSFGDFGSFDDISQCPTNLNLGHTHHVSSLLYDETEL